MREPPAFWGQLRVLADDGSQSFVVSARGKFSAGKNAAITTAVRFNKVLNPKDGGKDYTFDIPVVLRVKM